MVPKERTNELGEVGVAAKKARTKNKGKPEDFIIGDDDFKKPEAFDDEEDEVTSCMWR